MINFRRNILQDQPVNLRISEVVVKYPRENCDLKDKIQVMQNHIKTCDRHLIYCPFHEIGCGMNEVTNEEMKAHLNEDNYSHSKLMIDLINNLRNEMESVKNENIELKKENCQFKQRINNIELQSENRLEKSCEIEKKEMENRGKLLAVENENQSLTWKMETNVGSINQIRQQIEELKQKYEHEQQQENKNLNIQMQNCAKEIWPVQTKLPNEEFINIGKLEWQLDELPQINVRWIYSKPFYSGSFGYKMRLGAKPLGNAGLGVALHLMIGEFDNRLPWPFKYVVTIDVIDPENGNIYHSNSVKYSDSSIDAAWDTPKSFTKNNPIWLCGYGDIPINSLIANNKKLLLRCKVDKL